MRCSSCGHDNRADRRFCAECGAALAPGCTSCGAANQPGEKFCGGCGARLPIEAPTVAVSTREPETASPAGERRQLTVLFSDLVSSTELSTLLDAEDFSETIRAYHETATRVVRRFGGHVAQLLGDGLLVLFGYPHAHEDSAEQAVRAALDLVGAVDELGRGLVARIGLHSGPCVVSNVGAGGRHETVALGETLNVAARVQAAATPRSVLMSAATQRLVAGWFVVEEAGLHALKGLPEPMMLYRVVRASSARSRLEARSLRGLTPLVGREAQRHLLQERWAQARGGEGQVVLVTGEPGIGKSRLLHAFREQLVDEPRLWIECAASAYHQHTPFHAVVEMLRNALAWRGDESLEDRLRTLEQSLTRSQMPLDEAVPLVAPLLGLPVPERYAPLGLLPDAQRKRTIATLVTWLSGAARLQPVVLVVEDLHWADPSSLELLELLVREVANARVLVLGTARPEFREPWPLLAHHAQIVLPRLSAQQVREMAKHVAKEKTLTPALVDALIARTEGVPLFVEELSTAMLEEGDLRIGPVRPLPGTLHDSLVARLDRLGSAKEVAQIGAVLGRHFSYGLLRTVAALPESELEAALGRLADAELLYRHGQPPEATYAFKHALVRDAAYESLLKRSRQGLHGRVFHALTAEGLAVEPEVTAQHAEAAGFVAEGIAHYERAGAQARARSAHAEAVAHSRRAIAMLGTLPEDEDRRTRELMLQLAIGGSLMATRGSGHPDTEAALARALSLCDQGGSDPRLAPALLGLSLVHSLHGNPDEGVALAERVLRLGEESGSPTLLVGAHARIAHPLYYQGSFASSLTHAERAIAVYGAAGVERHAAQMLDQDWVVTAHCWRAWNQWHLGYPDRAWDAAGHALDLARTSAYPLALGGALTWACVLYGWRGDGQLLREHVEELVSLSERQSMPMYLGLGKALLGWSLVGLDPTAAVATLYEGIELFVGTGIVAGTGHLACFLAEALRAAGRLADAIRELDEALAVAERTGMRHEVAELHRLRAAILLELEPTSEAETLLHRALEIARAQGAKSYELRAATSLARHWQRLGRNAEARALLSPVYEWFTEGFDTRDLQDAKALLNA